MTIPKIDAHHHLWARDSPNHPMLAAPDIDRFFGNSAGLKRDFGIETFLALAAAQHVVASVYVESHYRPVEQECAAIERIGASHGFPQAIIGSVDPGATDLEARLDQDMATSRFRGVRVMVNHDADAKFTAVSRGDLLRDPAWRRGYAAVGARGLGIEVMALPHQLADLAALAADVPGTPLVLGHAGMPARRSVAEEQAWHDGIAALAELPQVSIKISGLGMVDHHWTTQSIAPIVMTLIDRFGPERCMFGSNFPVDALHSSYDRLWNAFDEITSGLGEKTRAALFHDTAARFYRIG